jgi:hypothetical protein
MFSMRHEFPTEWHRFLHAATAGGEQILRFTISQDRFPFFAQDRGILATKVDVFAKCTGDGGYSMRISYTNTGTTVVTHKTSMSSDGKYGGLWQATVNPVDLDVDGAIPVTVSPVEVEDIFLVVHYKLAVLP